LYERRTSFQILQLCHAFLTNQKAEKLTVGSMVMLYAAQFSCYSW